MSLINDALKRAKQAQAAFTSVSSTASPENAIDESGVAMRPADSHHGSVGLPVYFMPTLLFLICGACFFIVKGWDSRRQAGVYPEPVTVHAREPELTPAAPEMSEAQIHEAIPPNRQFALDRSEEHTSERV